MVRALKLSKAKIITILVLFVLYSLFGFFVWPYGVKTLLNRYLPEILGRDATVEKVRANPYTLTTVLYNLTIAEPDKKKVLTAGTVRLDLSAMTFITFSPKVSLVEISDFDLNAFFESGTKFSFSDLVLGKEKKEDTDSKERIPCFVVKTIRLNRGKITFDDRKTGVVHDIQKISLSLEDLDSRPDKSHDPALINASYVINKGSVEIQGTLLPFQDIPSAGLKVKTRQINVVHYLPYIPVPEAFKLAKLETSSDLTCNISIRPEKPDVVLSGTFQAKDLELNRKDETRLFAFKTLSLELHPSKVTDNEVKLARLDIEGIDAGVMRDRNGQFSDIPASQPSQSPEKPAPETPAPEKEKAASFFFSLDALSITQAGIDFLDQSNPSVFKTRVFPLNMTAGNIRIGSEDSGGNFTVNLTTARNETFESKGRFTYSPVSLSADITLANGDLEGIMPYLEKQLGFKIDKGRADLSGHVEISLPESGDPELVFTAQKIDVREFHASAADSDDSWVSIPGVTLTDLSFDARAAKASIGAVSLASGEVWVYRDKNGQVNWLGAVAPVQESGGSAPSQANAAQASVFDFSLGKLDMQGYQVHVIDMSNLDPVKINISDIRVTGENFSTTSGKSAGMTASMKWNKNGKIQISGGIDLSNMKSDFDISMSRLDIQSVQPYFTQALNVVVTEGEFFSTGKLALQLKAKIDQVKYSGSAQVNHFICLDKLTSQPFFTAEKFAVSNISAAATPVRVDIEEVALEDWFTRLAVTKEGKVNLSSVVRSQAAETPPEKAAAPEPAKDAAPTPQITIANVTVKNGEVKFSDQYNNPAFLTAMTQINGSIKGLSSDQASRADLIFKGMHGQSAPLEINGQINPLAPIKYVDLKISYQDIELVDFTPYSSKYLGYKIQKGRLALDLEYIVNGYELTSKNIALFDQFTLGDSVDSESATSLPVSLAISLLKDRKNQIKLDLPVTGRLDDPEFSVGGIILKMIGNLILKVATSPFSIIGAMFGGGEELGYAEFEPGHHQLSATAKDKLDKLIEILEAKPSIRLEIQGLYSNASDMPLLQKKGFDAMLKSLKLQQMMKSGKARGTVKEVVISSEEEPIYTHLAYVKATFEKPKDENGRLKDLPFEQKKALLIKNIAVSEADLRQLALNRSQNIQQYILSKEKVDKKRIFVLEPKGADPELNLESPRAVFSLK